MFDLIEEGVSKREYLGLGESYKIRVCVWGGAGKQGHGWWRVETLQKRKHVAGRVRVF